jgi:DNA recombination protein RmuC
MEILYLIFALITGSTLSWIVSNNRHKKLLSGYLSKELEITEALKKAENERTISFENARLKEENLLKTQQELTTQLSISNEKSVEIAILTSKIEHLNEKLTSQKSEIETLQKRLTSEFENIASKILKERAEEFTLSNTKNLSEILNPLKERIQHFEKKVDETYDKELRDKISLREEVRKLSELNSKVSEDAANLTKALKGDIKKQGNWGEVILERVLERSGLTKGQEYEREEVITGADQSVQRPDVIIHLPDNKHIIIDSKVSLVAYEKLSTSETEESRAVFLKEHINSLKNHVKLLSEKNYQNAHNINTPDFVLMFIPIEASFSIAVQDNDELFSFAWEKKIVIVSPTTLLATLRTISSIWKQEMQTKNAQEIARLSGTLYDKFINFLEDLNKIKLNLDKCANTYDDAIKKLKDGNGNMIRTAMKIKELGAKTNNKSIPTGFEIENEE